MIATMSANDSDNISPEPIFQMVTGFWVSKALMAAVELEVFTKLSGRQVSLQQLQDILQMDERPAEVFAISLVSLGLLEAATTKERGRIYFNSALSDAFLDKSKPSYMGEIVSMFDKRLYKAWDKLVPALKTNKPVSVQGGGGETIFDRAKSKQAIQEIKRFTHSMYGVSIGAAMALAKSFDFSKHRKMMDIGGGSGVYCIEVVKRNPHMSAIVLDLEPVCEVAEEYISKYNSLQGKIKTKPLDFWKEPFPSGYDVALLSHILHDYDKDKDIFLLKKICESLTDDDGIVLIIEWLINDEKTGPAPAALMGLNMVVETYGGRNYSFPEISDMLKSAGFKRIEKRPLVKPAELVIGHKQQ